MLPLTILHTECSRGWGGQEIRIFTEMTEMRKREHRLLLAAPEDAAIYEKCRKAGFPVFKLQDKRRQYPFTIIKLARLFKKEGIQVLNTHSSRDGWLGGIAGRLAKVPLIIRSRHIDVSYPNRFLSRIAYGKLPHHVITTSEKISQTLRGKLGARQISNVPTGIDLEKFQPKAQNHLRKELNIEPGKKLVGMVSVIRTWKGHVFFLEAAKKILEKRDDFLFIIAGEGPMRKAVEKDVQKLDLNEKVRFLGHREDVPEVLGSLDVLAMPSYAHEGVPQTLLQALAMGKAVVASRVGGIPEIIADGEIGLLVEPQNSKDLAEKILKLADDETLREGLGKKGRELVKEKHHLGKMCDEIETIYAQYLERSKNK